MLLIKVKDALRISTNKLDDEINDIIFAAFKDLGTASVDGDVYNNPLVLRAVILYCRANFGLHDNADMFAKQYARLKLQLMLTSTGGGDA